VNLRAEPTGYENRMTCESWRDAPEGRWWVIWLRWLLPTPFRWQASPDGMQSAVRDLRDMDFIYRAQGENAAEGAKQYAEARTKAWRADVRYDEDPADTQRFSGIGRL